MQFSITISVYFVILTKGLLPPLGGSRSLACIHLLRIHHWHTITPWISESDVPKDFSNISSILPWSFHLPWQLPNVSPCHSTVVQECILAGTNAIYDFSCFVIKTIISRYFGILRICEFHLPLNQTLFYTCTDIPNLTYHDFCKIHIKFWINVKHCILFLNELNCYAVLETGPDIIFF